MINLLLLASLSVLAGVPEHRLTSGSLSGAISLSTFISPLPQDPSSITWSFNGNPDPSGFPPESRVVGSEVFLRSPIAGNMRGNYSCRVQSAEVTATAEFRVHVNGKEFSIA